MKLGNKPTVREGNFLYLILSIVLLSVGSFIQRRDMWTGMIITQYILILLPPILYLFFKRYSIKENLRLNETSFKNIILAVAIIVVAYPIVIFFNILGISFLEKFGRVIDNPIPFAKTNQELGLQFLIVAISPGICEELMFRGFLMSSYGKLGRKKAILYSAIMFGVFHFNLQNLLGPIVLGIIFGVMVYKTNSILVSMVGHMTNNLIAILIGYRMNKLVESQKVLDPVVDIMETNPDLLFLIISLGVIAGLALVIVVSLINKLDEPKVDRSEKVIQLNRENTLYINEVEKLNFISVLPVILVVIIYSIFNYQIFFR